MCGVEDEFGEEELVASFVHLFCCKQRYGQRKQAHQGTRGSAQLLWRSRLTRKRHMFAFAFAFAFAVSRKS